MSLPSSSPILTVCFPYPRIRLYSSFSPFLSPLLFSVVAVISVALCGYFIYFIYFTQLHLFTQFSHLRSDMGDVWRSEPGTEALEALAFGSRKEQGSGNKSNSKSLPLSLSHSPSEENGDEVDDPERIVLQQGVDGDYVRSIRTLYTTGRQVSLSLSLSLSLGFSFSLGLKFGLVACGPPRPSQHTQ